MPRITRQRVLGEQMMISRVILEPGFAVPVHRHDNEQMVVMLSGHAEFDLEEDGSTRTVDIRGGQVLVLPGGVPHGCRAIERCEILDLFSPVSEKTGVDEASA
jgi:quercetin dioxygenase-like cupin family protein